MTGTLNGAAIGHDGDCAGCAIDRRGLFGGTLAGLVAVAGAAVTVSAPAAAATLGRA